MARILPGSLGASLLLFGASFAHGWAQVALWGGALATLLLGALPGRGRGWRISPEHFVERFGLIVIVALGESIAAIGVGARGLPLDPWTIGSALLGITVAAGIWWTYFDWVIYVARSRLGEETGAARALLARDAFSYLHLPMVAGIVLFGFGLKMALANPGDPLLTVPALGLVGGIALYLLAHVALRLRLGSGLGRGRPVASVVLLGLLPAATLVPATLALALVAAIVVGLIADEFFRHREARAWIRSRLGAFSREEARRVAASEGGRRSRRLRQRG